MTYAETIQFLYSLQLFGARLGLDRALRLAELAGNPQKDLRFIHVAGTNGKGSVCAMLESIYRTSGLRVGLYTSPHLVSFRERIQVNRQLIPEDDVVRLVGETRRWLAEFSSENHPTFFEVVTLLGLRWFAEQKCDLVIWETGLGGRLDATNIVTPLASVITNVHLDHEKWLGHTIEQIAGEKAGIVKPHIPVVTGAEGAALAVIRETAARLSAPLIVVRPPDGERSLGLRGHHQQINAAVATAVAKALANRIPIGDSAIDEGLKSVDWPGRFQLLRRGSQTIVIDGAHNPAGAEALASTLRAELGNQPFTLVLGILGDKKWQSVCGPLAALAKKIVVTRVNDSRTASPQQLASCCQIANPDADLGVTESLTDALAATRQDQTVVIAGSLYLVGEAMELLGLSPASRERGLNEWSNLRR